jgi:hypothetical protein
MHKIAYGVAVQCDDGVSCKSPGLRSTETNKRR